MAHFANLQPGCDRAARQVLRERAGAQPKATAESAERSAAALSYVRRQAWRYPLRVTLMGAAWMVLAFELIMTYSPENSNPVQFWFVITGMFLAPMLFIFGLCWLFRIVRRRRRVQLGQWVAYPARAAIMRQGLLRETVVGLEVTPTATVVIYPEHQWRSRIRRLVEREGQLLVLVLPPGPHAWSEEVVQGTGQFLYAGPSGRPVFAEIWRYAEHATSWTGPTPLQEQRYEDEALALAALARARGSAL